MTAAFTPPVNVAHQANEQGKTCVRCGAVLPPYRELDDATGQMAERPWGPGQVVIEYENAMGQSEFADKVVSNLTIPCVG